MPLRVVGIHQLHYLPWLRYFDKMIRADVFIVLDNIQFNKNGWQNRNKIKTSAGPALLTVPVREKMAQSLAEVCIDNTGKWRKKHWETLRQNYGKAPFFAQHEVFFQETYQRSWEKLNDLNRHMLNYFVDALGIRTPIVYASEMPVPGQATERLVNLIRAVGGNAYFSGAYALDEYLDLRLLEESGIHLSVQHWTAPHYPQLYGPFLPDLSIVDLLLNCGPESLDILRGRTA